MTSTISPKLFRKEVIFHFRAEQLFSNKVELNFKAL